MISGEVRPFETHFTFSAQTYDIDFAGIVSNIVYIRWLEDLRLKVLQDHWPLERQLSEGYLPVLLSTHIEYIQALRLFDRPVGTMWLTEMGKARFRLEAEFVVQNRLKARASHTCAFVRGDTLRPIRIPAGLRDLFDAERATP